MKPKNPAKLHQSMRAMVKRINQEQAIMQKRQTYGCKKEMKNPAAVALGRLGGSANTPAQQKARKRNAKKGGWPKGRPRNKSTDFRK